MADSPNLINHHQWGTSRHIHVDELVDIAIAHGKKGGESSTHVHDDKSNTFIVRVGKIVIETEGGGYIQCSEGASYTARSGLRHRMIFLEDSEVIEVYVANPGTVIDLADIRRFDEGRKSDCEREKETKQKG